MEDIQAANGLLMVSYFNEGGWSGTLGSLEHVTEFMTSDIPDLMPPNINYIMDVALPYTEIGFVPFTFVIDLETRELLYEDSLTAAAATPAELLALVEDNNI